MNEELVRRHEPVLRFAQRENFYPMKVDEYVQSCSLHAIEGNRGVMHIPPEHVELEDLARSFFASRDHYLVYADLSVEDEAKAAALSEWIEDQKSVRGPDFKKEIRTRVQRFGVDLLQLFRPLHLPEMIFERALRKFGTFNDHVPTYYYRISEDRGYTVVQYWYFYAYNDFATSHGGVNDHEGDWESVHLFFKGDEPVWAVYSAHGGDGKTARRAWDPQVIELEGDHPVVYVAAGSHANYYTPELEPVERAFVAGDVTVGGPSGTPWAEPQPLDAPWFIRFKGRWGARQWERVAGKIKIVEQRGGPPTGPRFTRGGGVRVEWSRPVEYAGLA